MNTRRDSGALQKIYNRCQAASVTVLIKSGGWRTFDDTRAMWEENLIMASNLPIWQILQSFAIKGRSVKKPEEEEEEEKMAKEKQKGKEEWP